MPKVKRMVRRVGRKTWRGGVVRYDLRALRIIKIDQFLIYLQRALTLAAIL